mmetsp:Transcript_15621/g.19366  ORF Transcript_15621/g.19366 Transcript_15621/m.19366 type:complete len:183 (+) Transcript_15621:257-805(+)
MPATVKSIKPKNNRMQTSSSLKTHSVWTNSIKYDPYAEVGEQESGNQGGDRNEQFRSLLKLANTNNESNSRFWKGKGLKGVFPEPMYGHSEEVEATSSKPTLAELSSSSSSESESESESESSLSEKERERSSKKRKRKEKERKNKSKSKKHKKEKKAKKRKQAGEKKKKKKKDKKKKRVRTD